MEISEEEKEELILYLQRKSFFDHKLSPDQIVIEDFMKIVRGEDVEKEEE